MKKYLLTFILCFPILAIALPQAAEIQQSKQMLVVKTSQLNSFTGSLQRFERDSKNQKWKKVGDAFPVVIGKNGVVKSNEKKEGDGRTPTGVYKIGPLFGFDDKPNYKLNYFPLNDNSVCVDDVKSTYYNQLIDSKKTNKMDWNSGEQMHQIPQYQIGGVIQYNNTRIPGKGSCIFLHIWKSPTKGTAGCVAMEKNNLEQVLQWLDARKDPVIVVYPL